MYRPGKQRQLETGDRTMHKDERPPPPRARPGARDRGTTRRSRGPGDVLLVCCGGGAACTRHVRAAGKNEREHANAAGVGQH